MNTSFQFDTREFTAALRLYEKATQKDEVEIVNRAAKNVAFRAMSFTPRASAAKIRGELRGMEARRFFKLVNSRRKAKGLPAVNGAEMREAAKKFVNKRASSGGYIRIGWVPAVRDLGGTTALRVSSKGNASKGGATKASLFRRVAEIVNASNESLKIGETALNRAFAFVADDMRAYGEKKMAATAAQYSS